MFYRDVFDNEKFWRYKFGAYSFGGFTTCIKEYKHLSASGNEELPMHEYDINEFLERFIPEIVDAYDIEDLEFTKCYIGYMSYIYGQTFTKLYENRTEGFGNGRAVRNKFESAVTQQAVRLSDSTDLSDSDLVTIEAEDVI